MRPSWLSPQRNALLAALREAREPADSPIARVSREAPLPLSPAQHRLWFLERLMPDSALCTIAVGLWLRGPLDPGALGRALREIVRRHQVLRTAVRPAPAGELAGVPIPAERALPLPLPLVEVAGAGAAEDAARRFAARPLSLADGVVLRAALFRASPDDHLLMLAVHHGAADGGSLDVLVRELAALYPAGALPEPPVQYADYAAWQNGRLSGELAERQVAYWRDRLLGARPLDLPTDNPWPESPAFTGAEVAHTIAAGTAAALLNLARRRRATPAMAALAAGAILLGRLSGRSDVLIGTPVDGRDRPELRPLVGCFVNLLPIRVDLSGATFGDVLDRVRAAVLDARVNGDLPFETLVHRLRLPRGTGGRVPLLRHVVQYAEPHPPVRLGELTGEVVAVPTGTAKFDLTFFVSGRSDGGLACRVAYSTELYEASTVDAMVAGVRAVFGAAKDDLPIGAVDIA